ncbi:MAG: Uma2 family endonuclease [Clostridiales bacterium]|nr:Uma2 family endonuclease [Clostridiales bacterium]
MPLPEKQHYTVDDIYNLPDGQRAELIDGTLYNMAPPGYIHQKLVMELSATLRNHIKAQNGPCEVLPSPFAVFLNGDDATYVEPDISVICNKNKITDNGCYGAPDLIIEIVSPSSRRMDYQVKNNLYSLAGVREYWIVDPARKRTTIYYYEKDEAPMIVPFAESARFGIYNDLEVLIDKMI